MIKLLTGSVADLLGIDDDWYGWNYGWHYCQVSKRGTGECKPYNYLYGVWDNGLTLDQYFKLKQEKWL